MKRIVLVAAAVGSLLAVLAPSGQSVAGDEGQIPRIKLTYAELRQQGIAAQGKGDPFRNSCKEAGTPRLSISDAMLAHFQSRGFSLLSLCLGLTSEVRFDPETGKQLPIAFVPGLPDAMRHEIPLDLPDCFRGAVPRVDCKSGYDFFSGAEEKIGPHSIRRDEGKDDANWRAYVARSGAQGIIYTYTEQHRFPGVPALDPYIKLMVASKSLPRGYGYSQRCCEGDDPEVEEVDLATYRKTLGAWRLWSDH